jgi:uncharacterized membrane protein YecN with MAPEG domain
MLPVTALYAGLLGLYAVWLAMQVIRARHTYRVALGTPHRMVERAARAHGNFSEYAPLGLVLIGLCEINGLPAWAVHALGTTLVVGRVVHAVGIAREPEIMRWRMVGMSLTFAVLGVAAAACLGLALAGLG